MIVERGPRRPQRSAIRSVVWSGGWFRTRVGRAPRAALREEVAEVVLAVEEARDAGAEDDADPGRILAGEVEAGVGERLRAPP